MRFQGRGRARTSLVLLALLMLMGCAKKLPPPGGKPDQEPPSVVSFTPDSGSTGVDPLVTLEVEFSEKMNQRVSDDWIFLAPYRRAEKREWKGKVFRYQLADSLQADRTYAWIVARGARDQRGNIVGRPTVSLFTTGQTFGPGSISGIVETRGHTTRDVYVWGFREDLGHAPDSTARDFDGFAILRDGGAYSLQGLPVPSQWRLFAFHDANRTLTFEPGTDHLTRHEKIVELTIESPSLDSLLLMSLDPSAPGLIKGEIVDSLAPPGIPLMLRIESTDESGKEEIFESPVGAGEFQVPLAAGVYRMWVYLDLDRNGRQTPSTEPGSEVKEGVLTAGEEITGVTLIAPANPPPGNSSQPGGTSTPEEER